MRVHNESETTGDASFRYIRAGDKPDDTLHALNFAYVLGRIALGEPLIGDHGTAYALRRDLQGGKGMNLPTPEPFAG